MPTTLYTTYVSTRILRPCDGPEGGFEMLFGLFEEKSKREAFPKISSSVQTNSMVPNMVIYGLLSFQAGGKVIYTKYSKH